MPYRLQPILQSAALAGVTGVVAAVGTPATSAPTGGPDAAFRDTRSLWMSRFEFTTEAQIRERVEAIAQAGFTDLYFQVRGQGDVLYPSAIETWDNKYGGGIGAGTGPGFDPLAVALDEANQHGLDLHAWINAIPMWRDSSSPHTAPSDPNHFYNQRPDLRLKDVNGNDMPLSTGQYVGVNPTHPDTADHIADLAAELTTNYGALGLDGVHLDYIRMVTNSAFSPLTYPQDPATRARFNSETGLNAASSPDAYKEWVGGKITTLVEQVRDTIHAIDPQAELSAAVWRDYDIGSRDYQQFADDWVENQSLDVAYPMVYTTSDSLFRDNVLKWKALNQQTPVAIGLGSYLHGGSQQTIDQLETARYLGANGFNIFSYGTLFSGGSLTSFGQDVKDYIDTIAARPDDNLPITTFEPGDTNYFDISPQLSGSNVGIGENTTATLVTDTVFEGTTAQRLDIDGDPGGWLLRHLSGSSSGIANPDGNRELIAEGYLGFWLRTLDAGITVRIAVDDVEGTAERGLEKPVIADGTWNLYQWDLGDDAQWEGWVNGNGEINGQTVTLDSIQFFGAGDATVWLDAVMFNPFGTLSDAVSMLAGDYDGSGQVEQADLDLVLQNWGIDADANGVPTGWTHDLPDGLIDQAELDGVLLNWGDTAAPDFHGINVPEPATALTVMLAPWALSRRTKEHRTRHPAS